MLVIRIWNYFRGYVIIKVEGLTLERFINLAISNDIYLWDIDRLDYTTIKVNISIKGFKELRKVIKKVGCRVSIIEKKGYPFLLYKFRYRKMLALGSVIALGIIFFLTSFVWKIDINGKDIDYNKIDNYLENMNIKPGVRKKEVDVNKIRNVLLSKMDTLSYVHAEIKGTKLIIEVKKRINKPKKNNVNIPCNIIASRKGVIQKVIAKNGKAIVEKGDIVRKGDILILGKIEDVKLEKPLFVHSIGEVYAKTYYTKTIKQPIVKTIKKETGKSYITRELRIGDKGILINDEKIPFSNYKKVDKVKKLIPIKLIDLPIDIITHQYRELSIIQVKQNVNSLKKISSVNAIKALMKDIPNNAKIISKDVAYSINNNILITKVKVEVLEDIGIQKNIGS